LHCAEWRHEKGRTMAVAEERKREVFVSRIGNEVGLSGHLYEGIKGIDSQ
jgi:hypothetical protein